MGSGQSTFEMAPDNTCVVRPSSLSLSTLAFTSAAIDCAVRAFEMATIPPRLLARAQSSVHACVLPSVHHPSPRTQLYSEGPATIEPHSMCGLSLSCFVPSILFFFGQADGVFVGALCCQHTDICGDGLGHSSPAAKPRPPHEARTTTGTNNHATIILWQRNNNHNSGTSKSSKLSLHKPFPLNFVPFLQSTTTDSVWWCDRARQSITALCVKLRNNPSGCPHPY